MSRLVHVVALTVAAILARPVGPALATYVLPLSLEQLAARSDAVAHVRVGQVRVVQTEEAPFRITELEVVEAMTGTSPGERLELWQRGDGYLMVVGDARLRPGDEGLVFLVRRGDRCFLTALAQSWWRLEQEGDARVARRDLQGLRVVVRDDSPAMPPNRLAWDDLRDRVDLAVTGVDR